MTARVGNMPPFFTNWGPATASNGGILTASASGQTIGGPKTWQVAAIASTAETLATWKLSDDAVGKLQIVNGNTADTAFSPVILGASGFAGVPGLWLKATSTLDTGSTPAMQFDVATTAPGAFTTRPLYDWRNNNVSMLQLIPLNSGANACLAFGSGGTVGAPTFNTRSIGNRYILFDAISASAAPYAIGMEANGMWFGLNQAVSGAQFRWYGGITSIMTLRGDGQRTYTAGAVRKSRIALTTPVTLTVTDDIVFVKLTTPGAVAVSWPASPVAGQEHCVVDATGDANANNITHTPASGNFNGGATKVQNVAYSRLTGAYTGAEWIGA